MAGSPRFKVYDKSGAYQASAKEIEAAAAVAAFYGDGATVRLDHSAARVLWTEGEKPGASYDEIALIADQRERAMHERSMARIYGKAA